MKIAALLAEDKPATFLAEPGKAILTETFAGSEVPQGWRAAKGKWEVAGGAIKGAEIPAWAETKAKLSASKR